MTTTAPAVRAVYDELFAMLGWWRDAPATSLDDDVAEAERALVAEARLLDDDRLDDWLAGWSSDGVLWVPLDPSQHPATDQAYFLDDVRRLGERVRWRRQPSAWSQSPAARTVRAVSNVESHRRADGALWVRSVLTIASHRPGGVTSWAAHQFHELAAAGPVDRRRRYKVLCVPALGSAVPHPGVLL